MKVKATEIDLIGPLLVAEKFYKKLLKPSTSARTIVVSNKIMQDRNVYNRGSRKKIIEDGLYFESLLENDKDVRIIFEFSDLQSGPTLYLQRVIFKQDGTAFLTDKESQKFDEINGLDDLKEITKYVSAIEFKRSESELKDALKSINTVLKELAKTGIKNEIL